jgi:hypothetical protein
MTDQSRATKQELREARMRKREVEKKLREMLENEGLIRSPRPTIPNRKCDWDTVDEEREALRQRVEDQLGAMRALLPKILADLKKIADPRNPKKLKHELTMVLVYGILAFVYHHSSRREANREMTRPAFMSSLRVLFPELDSLPHHDTLNRVLAVIDVDKIEETLVALVRRLIRKKKFQRHLVEGSYPIAMDGAQKLVSEHLLDEEWLQRRVGKGDDKRTQYYVSALEASLAFRNGMVIPLMTEFLDYTQGDGGSKQDCEQVAFHRLAARLKKAFPKLAIMVLLDGLYANGPIMELCAKHGWDFMIVLKDDSLRSVWDEFHGLGQLEPDNRHSNVWGDRRQQFRWVNDIEYRYGPNERKSLVVHVAVCEESWKAVDKNAKIVERHSRHAWLSAKPLCRKNLHERCNLGARHRWGIEEGFLVEKHQGYGYEHCFSYDWNAMRGFHYLMRLAHALNVIFVHTVKGAEAVRRHGVRGLFKLLHATMAGCWIDSYEMRRRLGRPPQLRLV